MSKTQIFNVCQCVLVILASFLKLCLQLYVLTCHLCIYSVCVYIYTHRQTCSVTPIHIHVQCTCLFNTPPYIHAHYISMHVHTQIHMYIVDIDNVVQVCVYIYIFKYLNRYVYMCIHPLEKHIYIVKCQRYISMDWFKGKFTGNHRFSH